MKENKNIGVNSLIRIGEDDYIILSEYKRGISDFVLLFNMITTGIEVRARLKDIFIPVEDKELINVLLKQMLPEALKNSNKYKEIVKEALKKFKSEI